MLTVQMANPSAIFILAKSAIPKKGRYGKKEWQDWYHTCLKAVELYTRNPEARILLTSAFVVPNEGAIVDTYKEVLVGLGIPSEKIDIVREGLDTIGDLRAAANYAQHRHVSLWIIHTLTHTLRLHYLCWKDNIDAKLIMVFSGLPRPAEAATDMIFSLLFPALDLLRLRTKFMDWITRRRGTGKM